MTFSSLVLPGAMVAMLPLLTWLLHWGWGRAVCLVGGGVIALQSTESLTAPKFAYLVVVVAIVATARSRAPGPRVRRVEIAGLWLAGLIAASSVASLVSGTPPQAIARDAAPYLLLAISAWLATDLSRRARESFLLQFTTWVGLVGTALWVVEWMTRRGYLTLPTLGLSSFSLVALGVSMTSARALTSRRGTFWWLLTGLLLSAALATGTRNAILLLLAPAGCGFWAAFRREPSDGHVRAGLVRALVALPVGGLILIGSATAFGADLQAGYSRVGGLLAADGGVSLAERRIQHELAVHQFMSHPLLGSPGTTYAVFRPTSGVYTQQLTLDTPITPLARWGIGGAMGLVILLVAWWQMIRPRAGVASLWDVAIVGFLATLLPQFFVTPVAEDKGFALCLVLVGAGALRSHHPHWGRRTAIQPQYRTPTLVEGR